MLSHDLIDLSCMVRCSVALAWHVERIIGRTETSSAPPSASFLHVLSRSFSQLAWEVWNALFASESDRYWKVRQGGPDRRHAGKSRNHIYPLPLLSTGAAHQVLVSAHA